MALLKKLNNWWLAYEYKHTTLAILAIILFVFAFDSALLVAALRSLDQLGYASGFIAGAFSVSFFTAAPALVLLVELSQHLDMLTLAFLVALGAAVGDWLMLKFFEERIFAELTPLAKKLHVHHVIRKLSRPSTRWIVALIGALIISTPLPDEIGLALMGISRYNRFVILAICFVLNMAGALVVISAAQAWW